MRFYCASFFFLQFFFSRRNGVYARHNKFFYPRFDVHLLLFGLARPRNAGKVENGQIEIDDPSIGMNGCLFVFFKFNNSVISLDPICPDYGALRSNSFSRMRSA